MDNYCLNNCINKKNLFLFHIIYNNILLFVDTMELILFNKPDYGQRKQRKECITNVHLVAGYRRELP